MKTAEQAMTEWVANRIVFNCGRSFRKYFSREEITALGEIMRYRMPRIPKKRYEFNERFGRLICFMAFKVGRQDVFHPMSMARHDSMFELFETVLKACEEKGWRFEDLHKQADQAGYDILSLGKLAKYIKGWK